MSKLSNYFAKPAIWEDGPLPEDNMILNFNGSWTDACGNHTWTLNNGLSTTTSNPKFGTGCAEFNGTDHYASIAYSAADFRWWDGDGFTIDAWVYADSWAGWGYNITYDIPSLIGCRAFNGATNYWSFGPLTTGGLGFYYYSGAGRSVHSASSTLPTGEWVHIAMSRVDSTIYIFINGILASQGAIISTPSDSFSTLTFGVANSVFITGKVDAMRITRAARFIPPEIESFVPGTSEPTV
jgi:hypothetical protein